MFGGRKTVYTAWKKLQKQSDNIGRHFGLRSNGYFGTFDLARGFIPERFPRTNERVTHEIKRAYRWLKSNNGRCYVATEGAHKGERRIAASRRVPAHIREAISLNWSIFA